MLGRCFLLYLSAVTQCAWLLVSCPEAPCTDQACVTTASLVSTHTAAPSAQYESLVYLRIMCTPYIRYMYRCMCLLLHAQVSSYPRKVIHQDDAPACAQSLVDAGLAPQAALFVQPGDN